jgi:hypothetical protein
MSITMRPSHPMRPMLWAIHRIAWKGNSRNSTYRMLHSLPLWEQMMAYFPALELFDRHKIWEQ